MRVKNRVSQYKVHDIYGVSTHIRSKSWDDKKPKLAPRSGATCTSCFIKKSVMGFCECNS